MAKDPAFPFYAQDYLVDTLRWTRPMKSLHVDLMAESWANGTLIDDNGHPSGLDSTDVELWLKIKHKWYLEDGVWKNAKLEEVRAARKQYIAKQSEKGKKSAAVRKSVQPEYQPNTQPKTNTGSTVVEPLESENEKENEKELKSKKDRKLEIFESLFGDEVFVESLTMTHKGKDLKQAFEECYTHHSNAPNPPGELWEWRQKLNSWLTIKGNGKQNKSAANKNIEHASSLMQDFAARHGT